MSKVRAAVFASGTGSNFGAIMEQHNALGCEIVLLVCDKPGAAVLEKAETYGVPTFVFDPKAFESKISYERELVRRLHEEKVTWVFLAGYMRIAGQTLLDAFEKRIINIHPSLLPEFPGLDAIGQAFDAGVKETGVTVHYVDEGIDTGPIIAQQSLEILPGETRDMLEARVHEVEHQLYPKVIRELMNQ